MQKKQNRVVHFFLIVFIIFFVGLSNIMSRYKVDDSNYSKMNSGWHIEINNTEYENVMLEDFRFPILNKGDILKMKGEFPKQNVVNNPILRIYTIHSDIEVRYNNRVIYEYGKELREKNKMLGFGYHFIHIPAYYAGAEIELIMHITENNAFSNMSIPEICNSDTLIRDFIMVNRVPLAINLFLIVFGILLFLLVSFSVSMISVFLSFFV